MTTSVVIPNWRGRALLEKNLPAITNCDFDEIIVVDDASQDGSSEFLAENYPQVEVIKHDKNRGFARSVNDGVRAAKGDIIILLNTDVAPRKGLKTEILKQFKNPDIFAISFNEEKGWGFVKGVFYKGLIEHRPGGRPHGLVESFWASGGSAAYDRRKWLELGGMRTLYHPFYWEDLDLGFRAWKQGWIILWDYNARVLHEGGSTIKKNFPKKSIERVVKRNQIFFFWSNIEDWRLWSLHLLWLPVRMLKYGYFIPVLLALTKLPQVILCRIRSKAGKVSDEQILNKFKD